MNHYYHKVTYIYNNTQTVKRISLLSVVALSKVIPQGLDLPAALLRRLREAEVVHSLGDVGVNMPVVDETPHRPLDVLFTPDVDERQCLLVWPRAGSWSFRWHGNVSVCRHKHLPTFNNLLLACKCHMEPFIYNSECKYWTKSNHDSNCLILWFFFNRDWWLNVG